MLQWSDAAGIVPVPAVIMKRLPCCCCSCSGFADVGAHFELGSVQHQLRCAGVCCSFQTASVLLLQLFWVR
jgi:hypothetical protein